MHTLINGEQTELISVHDRGLLYGDGCFETIRLSNHQLTLFDAHLLRLSDSCRLLNIPLDIATLQQELDKLLVADLDHGIIKILVSRGPGGRGYAPPGNGNTTRIIQYFELPADADALCQAGIASMVCNYRLAIHSSMPAIKHLNRLEQVLASSELGGKYAEGICLDINNNVIEGTKSNLVISLNGQLLTPNLSHNGVRGVMLTYLRERFLEDGVEITESILSLDDITQADEVFFCNSVFGIWPVLSLNHDASDYQWPIGPKTQQAILYKNDAFQLTR